MARLASVEELSDIASIGRRNMIGPGDDERKQKIFKGCMFGLMTASGVFLGLRYLLDVGVDPALIVATGLGVAVGMFFLKKVNDN